MCAWGTPQALRPSAALKFALTPFKLPFKLWKFGLILASRLSPRKIVLTLISGVRRVTAIARGRYFHLEGLVDQPADRAAQPGMGG